MRAANLSGTWRMAAILAAMVAVAAIPASADTPTPPTDLKLVGDHWTPWDPPEAGPDSYIIKKGDTLWDLAAEWLDDPYLWPQIWDENRYILDSHWIYPGDPLVIPGRPNVVPDDGPPAVAQLPDPDPTPPPQVIDTTPSPLAPEPLVLLATPSAIDYRSNPMTY